MRSYLPRMTTPRGSAPALRAKFGGLPWGFPAARWPRCSECGLPMSSLAQIPARGHLDRVAPFADRPDLGDSVLHVFICERDSICSSWDPQLGANAAFFVAERDLSASAPPPDTEEAPELPEAWIEDWIAHDDEVTDELAADFVDYERFYALPDALQFPHEFNADLNTKIGGVPYWTGNGPLVPPAAPFRYVMQVDKYLTVEGAEDGFVDVANFCSDGVGYLFVDVEDAEPRAMFQINR